MASLYLLSLFLLCSFPLTLSHSTLSFPQPIAPMTCRMGGDPRYVIEKCAGPCDLRAIKDNYSNFNSPSRPAATFKRGQTFSMKYQRNNHGPGGFIRVTLVRPEEMMLKKIHERNAFHFSCWGAKAVRGSKKDARKDKFGFSVTGNDGSLHKFGAGYYVAKVRIPECVADGDYVLGWAWYGGMTGPVKIGQGMQKPMEYRYFGDYWGCSFVRIRGGAAVKEKCKRTFDGDMKAVLGGKDGCMSGSGRVGECTWEYCTGRGKVRKPWEFEGGRNGGEVSRDFYERGGGNKGGKRKGGKNKGGKNKGGKNKGGKNKGGKRGLRK